MSATSECTCWTTNGNIDCERHEVTLAPGETWVADEECMTFFEGNYLADWVPMHKGDPWRNTSQHSVTFQVDYGDEVKP